MTIQFLRGTTAANNSTTGQEASLTVDTTADNLRLHDGVTAGGVVIPNETNVETITRDSTAIQESTVAGQNFTYKDETRVASFGYFRASSQSLASGANIIYDQPTITSPHYNSSTGVFTVPVSGLYLMGVNFQRSSTAATASQLDIWLSKNNESFSLSLGTSIPGGIPALFPASLHIVLNLIAGDTVSVKTSGTTVGTGSATNAFYGYLI